MIHFPSVMAALFVSIYIRPKGLDVMAAVGTVLPFVRGIDLTKNDFSVRTDIIEYILSQNSKPIYIFHFYNT